MTATGRARSPTNSPPPTSARRFSARSRPRRASRTPTRSRRSTASTACGSAISTCRSRSAFPGEFDHPKFKEAIETTYRRAPKKHNKALGRLVPTVAAGRRALRPGLRLHLLFRRRLGVRLRCAALDAKRSAQAARRLQAESSEADMAEKIPRRALRRFPQGRRLADLSRFRPRAAQERPGHRSAHSSSRRTASCAASSSRISTR